MAYLLRGTNESGDPIDMSVECCWRCGNLVNIMLVTMEEHIDRAHPLGAVPRDLDGRHALDQ